jgi:hypothetical protein|tara:strand:+ start:244 stop:705 length:462 start_codon:yes stop_codon:yes gene_type:complete
MKASVIMKASNVEDLKLLGSYRELKKCLEDELGTKLGINGWDSFYGKIISIKCAVVSLKKEIKSIYKDNMFLEAKSYLSKVLGIKVKARGWKTLKCKISVLMNLFVENSFDPYEYYEKNKLKKFRESSKLEGIVLDFPDASISLESILAKYQR